MDPPEMQCETEELLLSCLSQMDTLVSFLEEREEAADEDAKQ